MELFVLCYEANYYVGHYSCISRSHISNNQLESSYTISVKIEMDSVSPEEVSLKPLSAKYALSIQ